jgi:TRAP-type uncharacterized transport system substrate-binding protein
MTGTPEQSGRSLWYILPLVVLVIGAFALALPFVSAPPPRQFVLAAASKGSPYYDLAERYRVVLAKRGVTAEIKETAGSADNLKQLTATQPTADAAIVQGGIANAVTTPGVEALGRVMYEPVWVFRNTNVSFSRLAELKGRKVLVGPAGSGTAQVALKLLSANGVTAENTSIINMELPDYVDALATGAADAGFLVLGPKARTVARLFAEPRVALVGLDEVNSYVERFPFLSRIELKRGIVDFARDVPPHDTPLITTTAAVVVRKTMHPALVGILTQAMMEVHGAPSVDQNGEAPLLEPSGLFPIRTEREFATSPAAQRTYTSGPRFLEQFFPFWIAALLNGLLIMIVPMIGVLLPVVRFAPAIYGWHARRRILRWYKELKRVEWDIKPGTSAEEIARKQAQIDRIEGLVNELPVPLGFANMFYDLRQHIDVVRRRLQALGHPQAGPAKLES